MSRPILLHYPVSFSSQIARLVLVEKGVSWRSRLVDIVRSYTHYRPSYMRMNPFGVVPTLKHFDLDITECITIALYVNNNFAGPLLVPTQDKARTLMEQWVNLQQRFPEREFAYSLLKGFTAKFASRDLDRRIAVLTKHAKKNAELEEAYQAKIDDLSNLKLVIGDERFAGRQIDQLCAMFAMLEEVMRHSKWLAGPEYSLADTVWTVFMARLEMLGLSHLWEDGEHPFLEGYYRSLKQRPSFKKAKIFTKTPLSFKIDSVFSAFPFLRYLIFVIIVLGGGFLLGQAIILLVMR